MQDRVFAPASQVNAIQRMARHARAFRTALRWMVATSLPIISAAIYTQLIGSAITSWQALLLGLPALAVALWIAYEQESLYRATRELHSIFVPGCDETRQSESPTAIGPLLDMTLTGALYGNQIEPMTDLLCVLLKSIQEDGVVLNETQRRRLHEFVTPERKIWAVAIGHGKEMAEIVHHKLCPAAIYALGVLGNGASIPVLKRFAEQTDNQDLRQTALCSIERIHDRVSYGPGQLLRASQQRDSAGVLLRSSGIEDVQKEDLLRASSIV